MNELIIISFSTEKEYLNQILSDTQNYFGDSVSQRGFQNEIEILEFLKSSFSDNKIQVIILGVTESNSKTLQFLNDVNQFAPNAIKLVISEITHLLKIQEQIKNLDSIQFLNRTYSKDDFKLAVNTAKNQYSKLQILINQKSEISGSSQEPDKKKSTKLEKLISSNIEKEKVLYDIVHDLKSPFAALLGISEILISDWDELSEIDKLDLIKGFKSTSENTIILLNNLPF